MKFLPEDVRAPSMINQCLEARVSMEIAATVGCYALLRQAPRGDGHPVLVLPGFLTNSFSTAILRQYLKDLGYRAHRWKLGLNTGPVGQIEEAVLVRVRELRRRYQHRVSLVGWSLGGVYARELARMSPNDIRSVITLGSPVRHHACASVAWLYAWVARQPPESIDPEAIAGATVPPPVPTTCIYSRSDGIVPWRCSLEQTSSHSENIRVESSHLGLGSHPLVLWAVADRLAQPEGQWKPFDRSGFKRLFYGEADQWPPSGTAAAAPSAHEDGPSP